MPELLGATNPVPGYDKTTVNRNITVSPVKDEDRPALFDVMLHSVDYFREEMEKVEAEQPYAKSASAQKPCTEVTSMKARRFSMPQPSSKKTRRP